MNTVKRNRIPKFKNEDDERTFWAKNDSTDFVDWNKATPVQFSKLKPSVHCISLRLPDTVLGKLKILANKKDVPYQTLLKIYLSDRVKKEFQTV